MVALILSYNSIARSTCKDDISASAICHLYKVPLMACYIGRSEKVYSYNYGGLPIAPHSTLLRRESS